MRAAPYNKLLAHPKTPLREPGEIAARVARTAREMARFSSRVEYVTDVEI
jgi:hypothetical protein